MDTQTNSKMPNWMLPSDALNRHIPPIGLLFSESQESQAKTRYGFFMGSIGCLLGGNVLSEVVNNPSIYKLPTHSEVFIGVINQRGNIVPVFDFRGMLGESSIDSSIQTVLVLGQSNRAAGFMIDGLPQTVQVTEETSDTPIIPEAFTDYITPAFTTGDRAWAEFDHHKLLLDLASGSFNSDLTDSSRQ